MAKEQSRPAQPTPKPSSPPPKQAPSPGTKQVPIIPLADPTRGGGRPPKR